MSIRMYPAIFLSILVTSLMLFDPYPGAGGRIDCVDSGDPHMPVVLLHDEAGRVRLLTSEGHITMGKRA